MKDARRDFKYRLVMPEGKIKMLALPIIKELPVDPVWEKTEEKIGGHIARRIRYVKMV